MRGKEWTHEQAHAACASSVPMAPARVLSLSLDKGAAHAEHLAILNAPEAREVPLAVGHLDGHLNTLRANPPQIRAAHPDHSEQDLP